MKRGVSFDHPNSLLIKWRMNGVSPSEIAKRVNAKPRAVQEKLRVWKKKKKLKYPEIVTHSFNKKKVYEAAEHYKSGLTLSAVGKIYGVTGEAIRLHFKKHGIKTRAREEMPLKITRCKRGHEITRESGNRGKLSSGLAFCIKCREFRAKGLHLKTVCDKGHKIEGDNAYLSNKKQRSSARCRICHNEYQRFWQRRRKKTPKSRWKK